MASGRELFDEGLKQIQLLHDVRENRLPDAQDKAWDAIQRGIKSLNASKQISDAYSPEHMCDCLEFLLMWGRKRKILKGKVQECLQVLLEDPKWLQVARRHAELNTSLREFSGEGSRLSVKLDAEEPLQEPAVAKSMPEFPKVDEDDAKAYLVNGMRIMHECDWCYPLAGGQNNDRDNATIGFETFLQGVNKLLADSRRTSVSESAEHIEDLVPFWFGVSSFLLSMSRERKQYTERIMFIVRHLSQLSDGFKNAVDDCFRIEIEEADLELSRRLQAELDGSGGEPCTAHECIDDEAIARQLQSEFDAGNV